MILYLRKCSWFTRRWYSMAQDCPYHPGLSQSAFASSLCAALVISIKNLIVGGMPLHTARRRGPAANDYCEGRYGASPMRKENPVIEHLNYYEPPCMYRATMTVNYVPISLLLLLLSTQHIYLYKNDLIYLSHDFNFLAFSVISPLWEHAPPP